ncbi:hypothetical protein CEXT_233321 [Caerostris extrusa]|uniref:Uncharacterized protein n=1 Tax=Caerostris extrusa TaxID=172846 RepID=A0AAV4WP28_CAEEX|nr:hypothetical protein CEXT_233321 [Caerostris extrusa]
MSFLFSTFDVLKKSFGTVTADMWRILRHLACNSRLVTLGPQFVITNGNEYRQSWHLEILYLCLLLFETYRKFPGLQTYHDFPQ